MNTQKPEKRSYETTLDIIDIFRTIQGEGPYSGNRAIFVRLAGCNLECIGCDTNYTKGRNTYSIKDTVDIVEDFSIERGLIVITGGEPFRQAAVIPFANKLVEEGFLVQFETNGTYPIPEELNEKIDIVVSPKTQSINKTVEDRAKSYKYVLSWDNVSEKDGLPLKVLGHPIKPGVGVARPNKKCFVFITPEEDIGNPKRNKYNYKAVVNACLEFGYTAQLQIHKILGIT